MEWRWKRFNELELIELYSILQLRERVFVVEQACVYLDCDGLDPKAWHLCGYQDDQLHAYLRVFPPNIKYKELSIGRVVTAREVRKSGLGKSLLTQALSKIQETFGESAIRISAQAHLEKFYENFEFRRQGNEYLEDNIPHIEMLRSIKKSS